MKVGDVVIAVDGTDIRSMDDLVIAVRRHAIGETAKLTVRRGDQTLDARRRRWRQAGRLRDAVLWTPRSRRTSRPPRQPENEGPGGIAGAFVVPDLSRRRLRSLLHGEVGDRTGRR